MLKQDIDDYLYALELEGKSQATLKKYGGILSMLAEHTDTFSDDSLTAFYNERCANLSASTRRYTHVILKSFGEWMVDQDRAIKNPMRKLKSPKGGIKVPRPVPFSEIPSLNIAIDKTPLKWRVAFKLIFALGLRASEVLSINLEGLDLHEGNPSAIFIGKGNKERKLPLNPSKPYFADIKLYVNALGRKTGPLFATEDGEREKYRSLNYRWNLHVSKEYVLHQLRHTKATEMLHAGATLHQVQEFLGHSDPNTTTAYTMGGERYQEKFKEFV